MVGGASALALALGAHGALTLTTAPHQQWHGRDNQDPDPTSGGPNLDRGRLNLSRKEQRWRGERPHEERRKKEKEEGRREM
jgi:hypothetical protein